MYMQIFLYLLYILYIHTLIYISVYSQGYQNSTVCPVCTVWPHFPIHCGHFRLCTLWVSWRQQPAKRGLQTAGCCSQRSFSFIPPGSSYLAFLALFCGVAIALPFYLLCFRKIVKTLSLSVENDVTPADLPFLHLRPWILFLCYKSFPRCHLKRLSIGWALWRETAALICVLTWAPKLWDVGLAGWSSSLLCC